LRDLFRIPLYLFDMIRRMVVFKYFIYSCNMCEKSQKNISWKSMNTYLSRNLRGVKLGFMLFFCTNSSSFLFNQLFIFALVGFHGLDIPFYILILLPFCHPIPHYFDASSTDLICSIQFSSTRTTTKQFVGFDYLLFYWS